MSHPANFRSLLHRIALSDIKAVSRYYCNKNDENIDEEQKRTVDPSKDRTKIIPVETSIRYLESKAYGETYGNNPVWKLYRRNHKGGIPPRKTRKSCVRGGIITTGNPCPICRDEYLVLDHRNTKLLQQFISEYTGQILEPFNTGLCQKKQKELLIAIERAWDQGYLTYDIPFRHYDYSLYIKSSN
ncbi:unnamed protein product, partial [Iphiclides podalirius]